MHAMSDAACNVGNAKVDNASQPPDIAEVFSTHNLGQMQSCAADAICGPATSISTAYHHKDEGTHPVAVRSVPG